MCLTVWIHKNLTLYAAGSLGFILLRGNSLFPSGYRSDFSLPYIISSRFSCVTKVLNIFLYQAWQHPDVSEPLRSVQAASVYMQRLLPNYCILLSDNIRELENTYKCNPRQLFSCARPIETNNCISPILFRVKQNFNRKNVSRALGKLYVKSYLGGVQKF